jgi:pimeloyl-ACP methyl ester carboxylesterase
VAGRKVLHEARGHGRPWDAGQGGYDLLADDLLSDADRYGATQALGVSLGAGSLLRLVARDPARFARLVLYLPASLDSLSPEAVRRGEALSAALTARDERALRAWVEGELPAGLTGPTVDAYVADRVSFLLGSDLGPLLEALRSDVPVPRTAALAGVSADVLVLAEEDDPVHPVAVAEAVTAALPRARLEVLPRAALFRDRESLLGLIRTFLAKPTG